MFTPRLCDYRRAAPDYSSKMEDVPVWAVRPNVEVLNHRSVIFRQINKDNPRTHHDALEFPDGQTVLLTDVFEGQEATVLQFPVQAVTAADLKVQERVFYAG